MPRKFGLIGFACAARGIPQDCGVQQFVNVYVCGACIVVLFT